MWQHPPSATVSTIAARGGLNDTGKFYLYASQAKIDGRASFQRDCPIATGEKTVVLGCYSNRQIFLFDVTDSRLDGVEEVTAAHEMLHAVYERLDSGEKNRVNKLLEAEFAQTADERLKNLIDEYKKFEPDEINNELHSILATEVKLLSPELEKYYSQYFSDRQKTITLWNSYQHVFTDLKNKQDALVAELSTMADQIDARQAEYERTIKQLNSDITTFNAAAQAGSLSSYQFSSQRSALETRQATLEQVRVSINQSIDDYNKKKTDLDALNLEAQNLNKSIDSSVKEVPAL